MVGRSFSESPFEISEEEFLETTKTLTSGTGKGNVWASLQSKIASLFATPFQVQVSERTIHLLLPRQSPDNPPRIEMLIFLPKLGVGIYEKRTNEKGDIRLSMRYPANRLGDAPSLDLVEFVLATSEEFLTVADTSTRVH